MSGETPDGGRTARWLSYAVVVLFVVLYAGFLLERAANVPDAMYWATAVAGLFLVGVALVGVAAAALATSGTGKQATLSEWQKD